MNIVGFAWEAARKTSAVMKLANFHILHAERFSNARTMFLWVVELGWPPIPPHHNSTTYKQQLLTTTSAADDDLFAPKYFEILGTLVLVRVNNYDPALILSLSPCECYSGR